MKRYASVMLAILLVAGMGTTNIAGASLTWNVDFWATGNPTPEHNYAKGGPGDLGGTFILLPSEKINVDLYFSTDVAITSNSWNLKFDSSNLAVSNTTGNGSPWVLPTFELASGSVKYQAAAFAPGVTGSNIFFGSVLFECTGISIDQLVLSNYLGYSDISGAFFNFTDVQLGTLNQVPIPGAVWLLGSGLLGLVGLSRKWRK